MRPIFNKVLCLQERLTALPLKSSIPNRTVADRGRDRSDQEDTAANKMSSPMVPRMIEDSGDLDDGVASASSRAERNGSAERTPRGHLRTKSCQLSHTSATG